MLCSGSLASSCFRRRRKKNAAKAISTTAATAPIAIPTMAPVLREEPPEEPPESLEDDDVGVDLPVLVAKFARIVTMFSSAPSFQVHCETLKIRRS